MLRESNAETLHWADKTWSVLHARQLEASEDRLAVWPQFGLFTVSDAASADALWRISYACQEHPLNTPVPSLPELRRQVCDTLPEEAALLSIDEMHMVYDMMDNGGVTELEDMEDMGVAESLVRRLWCWQEWLEDDRVLLHLPQKLLIPLMKLFEQPVFQYRTGKLYVCYTSLHALLYLNGSIRVRELLPHLRRLLPDLSEPAFRRLTLRWMKAGFDCCYDQSGELLLIHPGLADPERAPSSPCLPEDLSAVDPDRIFGTIPGILPEETAVFSRASALLKEAVRPELTPEEAAEDLLILAKQSVPEAAMQEVLGTMLSVLPTPAMRDAVREINLTVPRWPGFRPTVLH